MLEAIKDVQQVNKYGILKQIDQPESSRRSKSDKIVDFELATGATHKIPATSREFRINSKAKVAQSRINQYKNDNQIEKNSHKDTHVTRMEFD